jgi:hypothetical protein
MALPEPGRAGARELGGAPRDGDFARLLEAASAPSAHRMRVDETPGLEDADSRAARAGRFSGSPPAPANPAAPYGPPGMAEGRIRTVPPHATSPDGMPDPSAAVAGAVSAGSRRPLKDRIVAVLFGVAALWLLLTILSAAAHDVGDATGLLVVGAIVAFLVLRNRSRRQRPPDAS